MQFFPQGLEERFFTKKKSKKFFSFFENFLKFFGLFVFFKYLLSFS